MQIIWTQKAAENLENIEAYVAKENPAAAIAVILTIIETVEHLSVHPHLGKAGRIVGTRELVVPDTAYIVAYRIKSADLQILSVLHGAMQWPEGF